MKQLPDVVLDNTKVGTALVVNDMETAAEHLAAEPAMAFTYRELASFYDKRDFPLDKVLVVKSVFPCAEVVEYRSLRPRRRAPSWGKTFTREVPEDG